MAGRRGAPGCRQRRSLCRTQSSRGGTREGEARGQVGGQGLGTCGQGAHLSCRSKAAVRQGRSSSAWSISTAVEASSRAGRSPTNSAVRGGLFQARNCGGEAGGSAGPLAGGGHRPGGKQAMTSRGCRRRAATGQGRLQRLLTLHLRDPGTQKHPLRSFLPTLLSASAPTPVPTTRAFPPHCGPQLYLKEPRLRLL